MLRFSDTIGQFKTYFSPSEKPNPNQTDQNFKHILTHTDTQTHTHTHTHTHTPHQKTAKKTDLTRVNCFSGVGLLLFFVGFGVCVFFVCVCVCVCFVALKKRVIVRVFEAQNTAVINNIAL